MREWVCGPERTGEGEGGEESIFVQGPRMWEGDDDAQGCNEAVDLTCTEVAAKGKC